MPGKKKAKPAVKRKAAAWSVERLAFASLVAAIQQVHERSATATSRLVNQFCAVCPAVWQTPSAVEGACHAV